MGRIHNLTGYFWPELFSGGRFVLGVRSAARVPAPDQATGFVWIESGYTWLLWSGGIAFLLAFIWFVVVTMRWAVRLARHRMDEVGVAALVVTVALVVIAALMVVDPHLTYRWLCGPLLLDDGAGLDPHRPSGGDVEHVIARSTASHDPRARPHSGVGGVVMGGDYQGLGIARSLGRLGVPVIVIDDERSIAGASRYVRQTVRVPDLRSEEATVAGLRSLVEHHGAQGWVLFPTRDEQVATLAKRLVQLEAWFRVPSPGWGSIRHAWDKRATYELASSLGIPIPMSWFPDCVEELPEVTRIRPLIVKPAVKEHFFYATGVKAWRVDDAEALRSRFLEAQALVRGGGVIVQELIRGSGTSAVLLLRLLERRPTDRRDDGASAPPAPVGFRTS